MIAAVDEEIRTTACDAAAHLGCQGTSARCLTHDLWDELGRQIDIFLNAVTLADVVEKRVLGMASVKAPPARERAQTEPARERAQTEPARERAQTENTGSTQIVTTRIEAAE